MMTMMMASTSDRADLAYAWLWLPGAQEPVPAGALRRRGREVDFAYGREYLRRPDAISLWEPELPLRSGWFRPGNSMGIVSCLRDASPDAWGRRVIIDRLLGRQALRDSDELDELTYLVNASADRIGALDVTDSPASYRGRTDSYPLDAAMEAAYGLDNDESMPEALRLALDSGTGVGGAQPKALLEYQGRKVLAKFSTSDTRPDLPAVPAEGAALFLARKAGVATTNSEVVQVGPRRALVVDRFDRTSNGGRRLVLSGLTLTGFDEVEARYGTYPDLLDALRRRSREPGALHRELFRRIAFNIAITNTDDHLRNHAAFWDGSHTELTPAYDLSPSPRTGDTAFLHLAYDLDGSREAQFAPLVKASHLYSLSRPQAREIIDQVETAIRESWQEASDAALLTRAERAAMFERQFLHPSTRYGYSPSHIDLAPTPATPRPATASSQDAGGDRHWVEPHTRGGKTVQGHWRRNRRPS